MSGAELARRVRFVLVAPSHPGNIGAAARALKTMGFARLSVVAPQVPQFAADAQAIALATHAADVLEAAQVHPDLTTALDGVTLALAMTGYAREFGPPLASLRVAVSQAAVRLQADDGDIAFVFGTERSGLTNDDVERCHLCCAIPADAQAGSLNLAQAVQVVAYECRLGLLPGGAEAGGGYAVDAPASVDQVEGMLLHLERALIALGYLDPATPRRLMSRLRRLFTRARPTVDEVDILRGIAGAVQQPKRERAGRKQGAR